MAYTTKFPDHRGKPPRDWSRPYNPYDEDLPTGEKSMSNKFLPFVVETSTPLHKFKTLLSRSKGMNQVLVASMFNLVLGEDIKDLRKLVKEMPEMPIEKLYEELLIKFPGYRVKDEILITYQTIYQYFPEASEKRFWIDDLKDYSPNDIMLFFCSMAYARLAIDDYTDFPYFNIMNGKESDIILDHIQDYIMFSDQGELIEFDNAIELRCFILYHGLFRALMIPNSPLITVKATIAKIQT